MVQDHHKAFLESSSHIPLMGGMVDELQGYVASSATLLANLDDMQQLAASVSALAALRACIHACQCLMTITKQLSAGKVLGWWFASAVLVPCSYPARARCCLPWA